MLISYSTNQKSLWAEEINTAWLLKNHLETQSCKEKCIHYKVIYKKEPNIAHSCKLICSAHVHTPSVEHERVFDAKSEPCTSVRYVKGDAFGILFSDSKTVESKEVSFLKDYNHGDSVLSTNGRIELNIDDAEIIAVPRFEDEC